MAELRLIMVAAALALALGGSAGAAGRPVDLHCASMPLEQPLPAPLARAARAFSPWERTGKGLRAGPVYLVAGSYRTAISRDGDSTDSAGRYLHRALVAVAPSYSGRVTITGARLGFSVDGASRCTVSGADVSCDSRLFEFARSLVIPPGVGWRIVRTELRLGGIGCFKLRASGVRLRASIPLAVPGP